MGRILMMERLALRVATVGALLNGGSQPYPTIANDYVFDSIIDDIADVVSKRRKPVILVRTDEDQKIYDDAFHATSRICQLYIEISVLTTVTNAEGELRPEWPQTDSTLEAMLDILEHQVWFALYGWGDWSQFYSDTLGYTALRGYMSRPRYTSPDRGAVRLAVRTLEFNIALQGECFPKPLNELDPSAPAWIPPNLFKVMRYALDHGRGSFHDKYIMELAKMIQTYGYTSRPRLPALQRVWLTLPEYEIEAGWKIPQLAQLEVPTPALSTGTPVLGSPAIN
jgi:hypothetical protein